MNFGQRLSELIEAKQITAYKLSKETGLSDQIISNWRSGKTVPSLDKMIILADYFGVSLDYLAGRTNEQAPISTNTENTGTGSKPNPNRPVIEVKRVARNGTGKEPVDKELARQIFETLLDAVPEDNELDF